MRSIVKYIGIPETNPNLIWYSDFQGGNGALSVQNQVSGQSVSTGNFALSTSIVKYGISSLYCNDSTETAYMQIPNIHLSGYDWCITGWFYCVQYGVLFSHCPPDTGTGFLVGIYKTTKILQCYNSDTAWSGNPQVAAPSLNTWFHVAYTKQGSTYRLFLNGVLSGTPTNGSTNPADTVTYINLGYGNSTVGSPVLYCNSFAIYRGNATYINNFTPPGFNIVNIIPTPYTKNNFHYVGD